MTKGRDELKSQFSLCVVWELHPSTFLSGGSNWRRPINLTAAPRENTPNADNRDSKYPDFVSLC